VDCTGGRSRSRVRISIQSYLVTNPSILNSSSGLINLNPCSLALVAIVIHRRIIIGLGLSKSHLSKDKFVRGLHNRVLENQSLSPKNANGCWNAFH
jgi:hypothetical protein